MFGKLAIFALAAFAKAEELFDEDTDFADAFEITASDASGVDVGAFFSRFGLGRDISDNDEDPLAEMIMNNLESAGPPNLAKILSLANSFPPDQLENIVGDFRKRAERNPDDELAKMVLKFGQPMVDDPEALKVLSASVLEVSDEVVGEPVTVMIDGTSGYRGLKKTSLDGFDYNAFHGVRYADPPTNEHRFQPPRVATQPQGIEDVTTEKPWCPQYSMFNSSEIIGDEDCLTMNIYSPKLPDGSSSSEGLPVVVYIHGGGFFSGGASIYQPDYFVGRNVVLAVVQYRLGSLGFLSNQDAQITGNYGMYDQVMALDWIKRHISIFGGNPNDVTLFGQSAGASSVHMHLISPLSKGLFHGAITHSGTALDQWAIQRDGNNFTARLAEKVGCAETSLELKECLLALPAEKIVQVDRILREENNALGNFNFLGPVIQNPFYDQSLPPFVSEEPSLSLRLGSTAQVPLMMGVTRDETVGYIGKYVLTKNNNNPLLTRGIVIELLKTQIENIPDLLIDLLDHEFFDGRLAKDGVPVDIALDASNDFTFRSAAFQTASLYSRTAPVYFFSYEYPADVTLSKVLNVFGIYESYVGGRAKVEHGDDLPMLFPIRGGPQEIRLVSENDAQIRELVSELWTNFAKTKNPTPEGAESELSWLPFSEKNPRYMKISEPPTKATLIESYRPREMRFLLEVMPKLILASKLCSLPTAQTFTQSVDSADAIVVESNPLLAALANKGSLGAVAVDATAVESNPLLAALANKGSLGGVAIDAAVVESNPLLAALANKGSVEAVAVDATVVESYPLLATLANKGSIGGVSVDTLVVESNPLLDAVINKQSQGAQALPEMVSTEDSSSVEYVYESEESHALTPNEDEVMLLQIEEDLPKEPVQPQLFESKSSQAQAEIKPIIATSNLPNSLDHIALAKQSGYSPPMNMYYGKVHQSEKSSTPKFGAINLSPLASNVPQTAVIPKPTQEETPEEIMTVLEQLPPHFQAFARNLPSDSLQSVYSSLKSSGQLSDFISSYG